MKIAFIDNQTQQSRDLRKRFESLYAPSSIETADTVVALGGDGLMLRIAHKMIGQSKPIYGMHCGSIGFLMNELKEEDLPDRIANATISKIHPLFMRCTDTDGKQWEALAINEISMLRNSCQAGKLKIAINDRIRMEELVCDGILIATPAGSTAYNLSARGPILPIDSPLLAMTPLNPFRPRHWHGALLSNRAHIHITVIEPEQRPVNAAADHVHVHNASSIEIFEDQTVSVSLLFDEGHSLDERILREQFVY